MFPKWHCQMLAGREWTNENATVISSRLEDEQVREVAHEKWNGKRDCIISGIRC